MKDEKLPRPQTPERKKADGGAPAAVFSPEISSVFEGRFRLDRSLFTHAKNSSRWATTDILLGKKREIFFLSGPQAILAADAARRASLVSDPRFVHIVDVGTSDGTTFVVTEVMPGLPVTQFFPTPATTAKSLAGELASALEEARRLGVHHGALSPEVVSVSGGRSIHISGLAWLAVMGVTGPTSPPATIVPSQLGLARTPVPRDEDAALRRDAVDCVTLLYAALTGHWPSSESPSLPIAPLQIDGTPVPPSALASGIPRELTALCTSTLGLRPDGPSSPDELMDELGTWEKPDFAYKRPRSVTAEPTRTEKTASPAQATKAQSNPPNPLDPSRPPASSAHPAKAPSPATKKSAPSQSDQPGHVPFAPVAVPRPAPTPVPASASAPSPSPAPAPAPAPEKYRRSGAAMPPSFPPKAHVKKPRKPRRVRHLPSPYKSSWTYRIALMIVLLAIIVGAVLIARTLLTTPQSPIGALNEIKISSSLLL